MIKRLIPLYLICVILVVVAVVSGVGYYLGYRSVDVQYYFNKIDVIGTGSNYYINIPNGLESHCIWRYKDENSGYYKMKVTVASVHAEHKITIDGSFWQFQVYCFDDQGNNYQGALRFLY